jgi:hypothetical protein
MFPDFASREFRRILVECYQRQGWVVPEDVIDYTVKILVDKIDKNPWQPQPSYAEAYLTTTRPQALLDLGNTCWFTRAVFPDCQQRRGIGANYYTELGTSCYERVLRYWTMPTLEIMNQHFEFIAEMAYTAIHSQGDFRTMWE